MISSNCGFLSMGILLALFVVFIEVKSEDSFIETFAKRSLPAYACKCCFRYGDNSCCRLCNGHRELRAIPFSPFASDYGMMKRSGGGEKRSYYPASLCCRMGIQGCCRQSFYRDYWYNKRSDSEMVPDPADNQLAIAKRYPAVLCCRLGIMGCCMQNFYQ